MTAHLHRVHRVGIDILPVEEDLPLHARRRNQVIHAVKAAQHRALATARRPDHGRDLVALDLQVHITHCVELTIVDIQLFRPNRNLRHSE